MATEEEALESLDIYNDEQKFYNNVAENARATIKQLEDGIKLNKDIKEMAEGKVISCADNAC